MVIVLGLAIIAVAGFFQGSFYLPMTYTRKWEWEHTWSIFSLTGMIVFSWIFIILTVPDIIAIYAATPLQDIVILVIFGGLWGIGGVLNGLAMDRLGMALAYPIVLGTVASLGTLVPLVVFYPEQLMSLRGIVIVAGTVVTIVGIIVCSRAYSRKTQQSDDSESGNTGSLRGKIVLAVMAGVMSSLLNIGFAFSADIIEAARQSGVPDTLASNVAWALILTSGGCVNVLYCLYLMVTRKTMGQFFGQETVRNIGLGSLMGLIWCVGLYVYGFAAATIGNLGVVVGWVLFMLTVIIVGNLWGIWRGEWDDAPKSARSLLNRGLYILMIAIVIVAFSNSL
ncbi:L-rhamnose/proton symporter RhaT [Candidatus Latescibacterota bacterium]